MLEIDLPTLHVYIGRDGTDILWWQMTIRALLLFLVALAVIRLGARRAFGRNTAFDTVLAVIVGSNVSRAITGNSAFFPTIIATLALVLLHTLFATLSYRSKTIGALIKGREVELVRDGRLQRDAMRRSSITERDLEEAARQHGLAGIGGIRDAYLERSGGISIVKRGR